MPKQIEDIIPSEKKSIRDIPIPENRRKNINLIDGSQKNILEPNIETRQAGTYSNDTFKRPDFENIRSVNDVRPSVEPTYVETSPIIPVTNAPEHRDFSPNRKKIKLSKKPLIIGGILSLVILSLGIFSLFSGATITYTPKSQALSFAEDVFTAKKSGTPEDLLFSVIKITEEEAIEAPASGEEEISQKASGVIIVYNNSSASSQRLIRNTRFETPEGKIYRIQNDITVPGQQTVAGKIQPGSLEVTVYADQPGESFNIGLSDFTLPGLKGDPKYSTIYARSKTAMTGGMVGLVKKVSAEDKKTAETTLETVLKDSLLKEAIAQVPENFILIPTLSKINYESLPGTASAGDKAIVTKRGNFSGIIFKKSDLVRFLASKKTTVNINDTLDANLDPLEVNFIETPKGDLALEDSITFSTTGDIMAVWISDENSIASSLLGKSKDQLKEVLNNYPSIIEANAVVRPFWKRSFPNELSEIKFIKEIK